MSILTSIPIIGPLAQSIGEVAEEVAISAAADMGATEPEQRIAGKLAKTGTLIVLSAITIDLVLGGLGSASAAADGISSFF